MSSNGYVKLFRKMVDWEWYGDPNTKAVFLHLLLTANYKRTRYRGVTLKPGQTVIGRRALAKTLGMSEQNVRTSLNHLKSTHEITIKATNKFSVVTIVNWESYQFADDEPTNELTTEPHNNQPTTNHTIRKKESKNKRKSGVNPPSLSEVSEYVREMNYKMDPSVFYDYYESVGWTKKNGQAISNWKAAVRTWEHREQKFGGEGKPAIEPPKYKVFKPEPEIEAVEMPDSIRKAVNKILK